MSRKQPDILVSYSDVITVQLLKIERDKKLLICFSEDFEDNSVIVRYGVSPENSAFDSSVEHFREGVKLNLINCVTDSDGYLIPTYIILEPDYLIDASAIAECFQDYLISPLHYFRNRFEEMENRSYILLGNLANFFLDELIYSENTDDVSFNEVFLKSFRNSPFEYTSCPDIIEPTDFREFMAKARRLFNNIKRVVNSDLPKQDINSNYCTLEPSFFSVKYGFQGRLDLLYTHPDSVNAKIIELKSGRLPYPESDSSKITLNHKVQTYIYRLMVDSVFGRDNYDVDASILYAASDIPGENLRVASLDGELEKSILNLRNLIVINELNIIEGGGEYIHSVFELIFQQINTVRRLPGFYINKINRLKSVLSNCTETEISYFHRYIQFISRELYHHKIGDIESETPRGMAALWNSSFEERAEALDVIYNLSILEIDDSGNDMIIVFRRNNSDESGLQNNEIVNFREGEICIVYPRRDNNDTVLNKQILKGTVISITSNSVEVRFRYKQRNRHYFEDNPLWTIEHDSLDTSYNNMYKSLFSFLSASSAKKELLMGIKRPDTKDNNGYSSSKIINKAMNAKDYFLIVGPPGTGKTSIYARRLIEEYYNNPQTNIMVIAYTNRAVDELCEAINAAFECTDGECDKYIRVGSEISCDARYRHRLLQRVSEKSINRDSLKKEISETRIFVSTLASITGKMELFNLKHFDVAIIDEASQILEPQVIGLLPRFDKFILIGDHNQLATIVLQDNEQSVITDPQLNEIGITDCRESLFERLIRRCISQGWEHSYTQLTDQGRMHEEIAAFPSINFYNGNLVTAQDWQTDSWYFSTTSSYPVDQAVANHRIHLFSTEKIIRNGVHDKIHDGTHDEIHDGMHDSTHDGKYDRFYNGVSKINEYEANTVVEIIKSLNKVYSENGQQLNASSIGIIAPYRNQIALIRHKLLALDIPDLEKIMIDTVERYQGSQRDIIIISFCINQPQQFKFLCNLNHDGTVDRKLNVALTRARHQLFLTGNAALLRQHPIYNSLVDFYKDKTLVIE